MCECVIMRYIYTWREIQPKRKNINCTVGMSYGAKPLKELMYKREIANLREKTAFTLFPSSDAIYHHHHLHFVDKAILLLRT